MHSVFATNTKYNFLNYKIPLILHHKKAHFHRNNKIPAEKRLFRKFFIYLHRKSYTSEMNALRTYTAHDRETLRGMMMDTMMCNRSRRV